MGEERKGRRVPILFASFHPVQREGNVRGVPSEGYQRYLCVAKSKNIMDLKKEKRKHRKLTSN